MSTPHDVYRLEVQLHLVLRLTQHASWSSSFFGAITEAADTLNCPVASRRVLNPCCIPEADDMNVDVPIADARRIEVVAHGLPLWHGPQLALDATIVSPLTRLGEAHPRADVQPGCAVTAAAHRKRHHTYPELARARRCRLVVVGVEIGGRFGTETVQLLRLLARHKATAVPAASRPAAITAWVARWSGLLAVAAQRAFAASLLELPPAAELGEGPEPELHELLAEARWDAA